MFSALSLCRFVALFVAVAGQDLVAVRTTAAELGAGAVVARRVQSLHGDALIESLNTSR